MKNSTPIVDEAKVYALDILENKLPRNVCYHNVNHTKGVVDATLEIGRGSGLNEEELEIVQLAGWFHDIGYAQDSSKHEAIGAHLASAFLQERNFPAAKITQVIRCIEATRMPQQPESKLEEVICDADMVHLAREDFLDKTKSLRDELENEFEEQISDKKWLKQTLRFLKNHRYFTGYAQKKYENAKASNLKLVVQILKKMKSENGTDSEHKGKKKKNKKDTSKKDKGPERGIETMFRLTSKNHLDLSAMADNKANILISINAIILSVVVSVLIRKLEEYPYLVVPTFILTLVCLITIVISILVTRPQVSLGKFSKADIEKRKVNLLFFGNFHRMKLQEYDWAVKEMMKDSEYLYSNLIQDIYHLGVVLGKKYRLLRVAYTFFMFGFVISVISFLVAETFFRSAYPY